MQVTCCNTYNMQHACTCINMHMHVTCGMHVITCMSSLVACLDPHFVSPPRCRGGLLSICYEGVLSRLLGGSVWQEVPCEEEWWVDPAILPEKIIII